MYRYIAILLLLVSCSGNPFDFGTLDFRAGTIEMEQVRLGLHDIKDVKDLMRTFRKFDINQK